MAIHKKTFLGNFGVVDEEVGQWLKKNKDIKITSSAMGMLREETCGWPFVYLIIFYEKNT